MRRLSLLSVVGSSRVHLLLGVLACACARDPRFEIDATSDGIHGADPGSTETIVEDGDTNLDEHSPSGSGGETSSADAAIDDAQPSGPAEDDHSTSGSSSSIDDMGGNTDSENSPSGGDESHGSSESESDGEDDPDESTEASGSSQTGTHTDETAGSTTRDDSEQTGETSTGSSETADGASGSDSTADSMGTGDATDVGTDETTDDADPPLEIIACGSKVYACGDTIDNDGDGHIDLADPDCTTPCDDSESSLQTNLPGGNEPCKSDCFWDSDSGAGQDKCEWNIKCDVQNPGATKGCEHDPGLLSTNRCEVEVPTQCQDVCGSVTPNGCDCFGCCLIDLGVRERYIYLDSGPDCSVDNPDGCRACTFHAGCNNPCEPDNCELCFGQTPEDLPDHCSTSQCEDSVASCASKDDCDTGMFCQTGCCRKVILD